MAKIRKIVAPGLLFLVGTTALAVTSYTYDELNRLTKVIYDDGRSISYSYDAAGNLLQTSGAALPLATSFVDEFVGTTLNPLKWRVTAPIDQYGQAGTTVVGGGALTVEVPGGSSGAGGETDGNRYTPLVATFGGDFEIVMSVAELYRAKLGSSRDHSGVRLYFGTSWLA